MSKYVKLFLSGLKYTAYLSVGTLGAAFGYLHYINTQIGPMEIDREMITKYYIKEQKMDPVQADRMYYWLLYDIALMRILTYSGYSSYCQRLNKKIVSPLISSYEQEGILDRINNVDQPSSKKSKALFNDIKKIRKENFERLTTYEFIVKEIRKQQKLMDTRKIVGLEKETLEKINKIHGYICETGVALKSEEVETYVQHLPELQARLPGDVLHKILFI